MDGKFGKMYYGCVKHGEVREGSSQDSPKKGNTTGFKATGEEETRRRLEYFSEPEASVIWFTVYRSTNGGSIVKPLQTVVKRKKGRFTRVGLGRSNQSTTDARGDSAHRRGYVDRFCRHGIKNVVMVNFGEFRGGGFG